MEWHDIQLFKDSKRVFRVTEGRTLILDCEYENKNIRIINVYAPNNEASRKLFFQELSKWCTFNTLIIGDLLHLHPATSAGITFLKAI